METIETAMGLIMHAGDARSSAMEALQVIRNDNNFELAEEKLKSAEAAISEAHKIQTSLLVAEAQEQKIDISLLLIHSQDHLMNAMTVIDLVRELIFLYKKIL